MNNKLFDYIAASPTAFHAVEHTASILRSRGYAELFEQEDWHIEGGKGYFVTRNGSSIIAFRVPKASPRGFMMAASHCDSPSFKIKENFGLSDGSYSRLSVEKYGGMLCSSWLDRPLSIAGRVLLRTEKGVKSRLVDLKEISAIIPNVAIHMNRNANDGMSYNAAVDMLPIIGTVDSKAELKARIAPLLNASEEDILTTDLFLYNPQAGVEWSDMISAPRLDDLQCAFASLEAFLAAKASESVQVCAIFDNEEVGSQTKQGASSTFLSDVLERISRGLFDEAPLSQRLANSFLVSCDNAHAIHPNHPEFADKNHTARLNCGVVIKYNANQRYTTDAVSSAIFRKICEKADVPVQSYANRADMPGGSTLGNIANTQVSLNTVDIGLPQLAMHSAFESAGSRDTEYMFKALKEFYEHSLSAIGNGEYEII